MRSALFCIVLALFFNPFPCISQNSLGDVSRCAAADKSPDGKAAAKSCVDGLINKGDKLSATGHNLDARTAYESARSYEHFLSLGDQFKESSRILNRLQKLPNRDTAATPAPPASQTAPAPITPVPQAANRVANQQSSAIGPADGKVKVGQYKCYTGNYVTFLSGEIGSHAFTPGTFMGYSWIFDDHHYANVKEDDRGTFTQEGDTLVSHDGPWGRNKIVTHYREHGMYGRPTLIIVFTDMNNMGLGCVLM